MRTFLLAIALISCGPPNDLGPFETEPEQLFTSAEQGLVTCGTRQDTGYRSGASFTITVVTADGKPAEQDTANAYSVMQQAAAAAGITISVVSGFRTMSEQRYLYACYTNCNCNGCNLACVPLPNAAVDRQARACGRAPIAPSSPTAVWNADSAAVLVSWAKAADDGGGESDAVRYVIWRKITGAATWGSPLASMSVNGATTTYKYKDGGVDTGLGRSYQYALAVQDCTPNLSGVAGSSNVVVP